MCGKSVLPGNEVCKFILDISILNRRQVCNLHSLKYDFFRLAERPGPNRTEGTKQKPGFFVLRFRLMFSLILALVFVGPLFFLRPLGSCSGFWRSGDLGI